MSRFFVFANTCWKQLFVQREHFIYYTDKLIVHMKLSWFYIKSLFFYCIFNI